MKDTLRERKQMWDCQTNVLQTSYSLLRSEERDFGKCETYVRYSDAESPWLVLLYYRSDTGILLAFTEYGKRPWEMWDCHTNGHLVFFSLLLTEMLRKFHLLLRSEEWYIRRCKTYVRYSDRGSPWFYLLLIEVIKVSHSLLWSTERDLGR